MALWYGTVNFSSAENQPGGAINESYQSYREAKRRLGNGPRRKSATVKWEIGTLGRLRSIGITSGPSAGEISTICPDGPGLIIEGA